MVWEITSTLDRERDQDLQKRSLKVPYIWKRSSPRPSPHHSKICRNNLFEVCPINFPGRYISRWLWVNTITIWNGKSRYIVWAICFCSSEYFLCIFLLSRCRCSLSVGKGREREASLMYSKTSMASVRVGYSFSFFMADCRYFVYL